MIGNIGDLRQYASDRGLIAPGLAVDRLATQALVRATDYIRHNYITRFHTGFDETAANVVPAVYEAAVLEAATPGFFTKTFDPAERKVMTEAAGIKWTLVGGQSNGGPGPVSTRIEALLGAYLRSSAGGVGFMVI